MKETSLSVRIPEELEKELERYTEMETLDKSVAVRKLLHRSLQEWREEMAIDLLSEGKLSFSAAAKFAGIDVWSFAEKVKKAKKVWVKDKTLLENDISKALS